MAEFFFDGKLRNWRNFEFSLWSFGEIQVFFVGLEFFGWFQHLLGWLFSSSAVS